MGRWLSLRRDTAMRTLAIRYWLIAALAIFFVAAVAPFVYIGAVYCASAKPSSQAVSISNMITTNVSRWTDPIWQQELKAELPPELSVTLLDSNSQELFNIGKHPQDPTPAGYTQILVMDGGHLLGI